MTIISHLIQYYSKFSQICCYAQSVCLLVVRAWIFKCFFFSGLLKTKNWPSTLYLFNHEYQVPLLPCDFAAYLGTSIELTIPTLMMAGIFTRLSALGLFLFNFIIFFSYPFLWTQEGHNGLEHHYIWALMIILLIAFGPGKISLDYLISKKCPDYKY